MFHYYALYKPYEILTQFSPEPNKKTLKDCIDVPVDVYPVGRLDYDSEGLLLLTNDTTINAALLNPTHRHERTYLVQVDGQITAEAIRMLENGVTINVNGKSFHTAPAKARILSSDPVLPERNPPIRFRKNIPASWISLTIKEGKNRQVRKMTAAAGYPTLRLVRFSIGKLNIAGWESGELRKYSRKEFMEMIF